MTDKPRGTFPWPDDSDPVMRSIAALTFYRRARAVLPWLLLAAGLAVDAVLLMR